MQIHLRRLTAFAAVAVGLMAHASPASAAFPDRETVAASSLSNSEDKGAVVTCPAGKRVVGSGADIAGIPAGSGAVVLDDVYPSSDTVTAYAFEVEGGTSASWSIRAWAVCGNPNGSMTTVSRVSVTSANSKPPVTVTCPAGKVVLGSGAAITGGLGEVVIDAIIPTTNTVTVSALEDPTGGGYAGSWSIRAYARCGDEPGGRTIVSRTSSTSSVDKGGSAPCPTGKVVFGGGFDIDGGAGETFIDDFIPTNASVLTFAMEHNDGSDDNGRDWSLRSYAICGTA
jgi:hypothetical protein